MEILEAMPRDLTAIEAVVAAAFGEAPDGRVVQMMRGLAAGGAARFGRVATDGREVVGYVGCSRGWVDARPRWWRCWCSHRSRSDPTASGAGSAPRSSRRH